MTAWNKEMGGFEVMGTSDAEAGANGCGRARERASRQARHRVLLGLRLGGRPRRALFARSIPVLLRLGLVLCSSLNTGEPIPRFRESRHLPSDPPGPGRILGFTCFCSRRSSQQLHRRHQRWCRSSPTDFIILVATDITPLFCFRRICVSVLSITAAAPGPLRPGEDRRPVGIGTGHVGWHHKLEIVIKRG